MVEDLIAGKQKKTVSRVLDDDSVPELNRFLYNKDAID